MPGTKAALCRDVRHGARTDAAHPGVAPFDYAGSPSRIAKTSSTAADIATQNPSWNPREVTREAIRALLSAAWRGDPPVG